MLSEIDLFPVSFHYIMLIVETLSFYTTSFKDDDFLHYGLYFNARVNFTELLLHCVTSSDQFEFAKKAHLLSLSLKSRLPCSHAFGNKDLPAQLLLK